MKILTDAPPQIPSFPNVNDGAKPVFHQINARFVRQLAELLADFVRHWHKRNMPEIGKMDKRINGKMDKWMGDEWSGWRVEQKIAKIAKIRRFEEIFAVLASFVFEKFFVNESRKRSIDSVVGGFSGLAGRWDRLDRIRSMKNWIAQYILAQKAALDSIAPVAVERLIQTFQTALKEDRQIFMFGNGGSAANASHFATDLGKGSSDKLGKRFRCLSLNDNVSWLTALANDYAYEDVFARQLMNYARPGDVVFAMSVSGNSPNVVKALDWASKNSLKTVALVGRKRGRAADLAEQVIVIDSDHFGRVEDAHMGICHMLCYAFMENPAWGA